MNCRHWKEANCKYYDKANRCCTRYFGGCKYLKVYDFENCPFLGSREAYETKGERFQSLIEKNKWREFIPYDFLKQAGFDPDSEFKGEK